MEDHANEVLDDCKADLPYKAAIEKHPMTSLMLHDAYQRQQQLLLHLDARRQDVLQQLHYIAAAEAGSEGGLDEIVGGILGGGRPHIPLEAEVPACRLS